MRLHRFYIDQQINDKKEIRIEDTDLLNQWEKVFRLKAGDKVILFDGSGSEYEAVFELISKKEAVLKIVDTKKIEKEDKIELHIFQSIIKKDNFEMIVQKCTEIGTGAFHPVISERSEKKNLNIERLEKIAKEASEQSGRVNLPKIFAPEKLEGGIEKFDGKLFVLDFDSSPIDPRIRENDNDSKLGILIGPEGGWSEKERELFRQKGIESISFGSQVLRAETAAIVASALILLR